MFNGQDYHRQFDRACEELLQAEDSEDVHSVLEGVEWVLWEAIRGALFYMAVGLSLLPMWPIATFMKDEMGWTGSIVSLVLWAILATAIYWFFRLVFWLEISWHVKGRKFGSGGL